MLSIEELNSVAKENDWHLFKGMLYTETLFKQGIELDALDNLLSLGNQWKNKILYYYYVYYQKEEFLIPDEYHDRYVQKIQAAVSERIHEHNKYVHTMDFDEPARLITYFVHEGFIHFFQMIQEELEALPSYEEKVKEITSDIYNQFDSKEWRAIRLETQKEKDAQLEEIKSIVLADEKFHIATNQPSRYTYANRLFEIHPEYRDILREAGYTKVISFFDEVWKIYKQRQ